MPATNKRCTIKDIAEYTGVATSTVSRVLNNKTKVPISQETRNKIQEAARELRYYPNINAKRLSANKSYIIAIEVPSSCNFHAFADHTLIEMLRGVEDVILSTAYKLLIVFKDQNYMENKEYLRLFREKSIDGLIIWGAEANDAYSEELFQYPVIFTNTYPKTDREVYYIGLDNAQAEYDVTECVIARGGRRLLYFSGPVCSSIGRERREGFLAAAKDKGIEPEAITIFEGDYTLAYGFDLMDRILSEGKLEFDAVISANDDMALGAFNAALKRGKNIPEDFLLAGGDGVDFFREDQFPLITFRSDCFGIGRKATSTLIGLIDGKKPEVFCEIIRPKLLQTKLKDTVV